MMTFISTPCIEYKDMIRELCIPECSAFGVMVTCEKCKRVWNKSTREWYFKNIKKAQQELEDFFHCPICPTEICREKVYLENGSCKVKLAKKPIAYLGKKELLQQAPLSICYQELSDCGADLPITVTSTCTEDNDYVGVIFYTDVPEGVDFDSITFRYPDFICNVTEQKLQQPECFTIVSCDGVDYGFEAIWPKCQLIHPNCNTAKVSQTTCFLEDVVVEFWNINEDMAIEIPNECTCGKCSGSNCGFTIELGDELQGEVCIEGDVCGCCDKDYIYVNYANALNCGDPDENLATLVSMIALLRRGKKKICDCEGGNEYIDYLLELDPSFTGAASTPFDTAKNFPYGRTRAGIIAKRLREQILSRMIKNGQLNIVTGGSVLGTDRRKKPFKYNSRGW